MVFSIPGSAYKILIPSFGIHILITTNNKSWDYSARLAIHQYWYG